MKSALLLVALTLASVANAAPPADAPILRSVEAGDPAPAAGCFLDSRTCEETGRTIAGLKAENASLRKSIEDAPSPVLFVAGGVVLGLLAGYAVARALPAR